MSAVKGSGEWIDEMGKKVSVLPGFRVLYQDEESRNIDSAYNFLIFDPNQRKGSELGAAEVEDFVLDLFRVCGLYGCTVGFDKTELQAFAQAKSLSVFEIQDLLEHGLLRTKMVKGIQVIFPTLKLVQRFEVPASYQATPR